MPPWSSVAAAAITRIRRWIQSCWSQACPDYASRATKKTALPVKTRLTRRLPASSAQAVIIHIPQIHHSCCLFSLLPPRCSHRRRPADSVELLQYCPDLPGAERLSDQGRVPDNRYFLLEYPPPVPEDYAKGNTFTKFHRQSKSPRPVLRIIAWFDMVHPLPVPFPRVDPVERYARLQDVQKGKTLMVYRLFYHDLQ